MKQKFNVWVLALSMLPIVAFSQTYQWQFGKQAGGQTGPVTSFFSYQDDESIRDIAVDSDNNTYYLATIWAQEQNLNGAPVTSYSQRDLFLFSTDCQGNVRWSRTIGGSGSNENAWNIEIDNNGGLYILASILSSSQNGDPNAVPIHLGDNTTLPLYNYTDLNTPDAGFKSSFLLKYNTANGNFVWSKSLHGDVTPITRLCDSQMTYMDSQKNIHAILGFRAGTHLNGMITVPASYVTDFQYYLVKFNYDNGNMTPLTPVLLPITGNIIGGVYNGHENFIFDESLNRYYLAGKRRNGGYGDMIDFSFNNTPIEKEAFLIAFNLNGNTVSEAWRKEINTGFATSILDDEIHSIIKDASTSDIYIAGRYYSNTTTAATFGSYAFPVPTYGIQRPFIMKLNSAGDVQWAKIPDAIPAAVNGTAYRFMKGKIVQNGNEIGFAQGSWGISWGGFTMTRPSGANADPVLFRFNKDTGSVLGMGEIYSNPGVQDEFTAIAVDNDGNYVLGGFFHQQLFTATDDNVPTMTLNVPGNRSQNFFTKYVKSACSQLSTSEVTAENAQLSFYPNPAQDYVMVSTKNKLQTFEVYSMTGQLVKKGKFENGADRINVQSLSSGNYVIKISTDKGSLSGKMIKK